MPVTRRLMHEEITYEEAKERETNILHLLGYFPKRLKFSRHLYRRRGLIEERVAHHLGLRSSALCHAAEPKHWLSGSFNVCVPVLVEGSARVLMRFPLPHRVGDEFRPGNGDEKARCEAGAYAWLHQECPTIPIPHLYGFGLSSGQCFTTIDCLPFFSRWMQRLRCLFLKILRNPTPTSFVRHQSTLSNELGAYLLLEYIEKGETLSSSLDEHYNDEHFRANLFRGLSRVVLALSGVPLPKIGSFIVDDDGFLRLANRPLTSLIHGSENEHIPVNVPRDHTFYSVDSYVNSLISKHDSRLRHQPNAVNDEYDCISQMSALTMMRAVRSQFFDNSWDSGPFVFCLTDLHASNIIVDKEWNLTCIIDLEWAASLPLEFLQPPTWLSKQDIDDIDPEMYNARREEFMRIFQSEEDRMFPSRELRYSTVMNNGWHNGTFWYMLAVDSLNGLHELFYKRIQPKYSESHLHDAQFYRVAHQYWTQNIQTFIDGKVEDKKKYDEDLEKEFKEQ